MALHRALQVCRLGPFPSSQSGVGGHASPAKSFSSLGGRGLAKGGDLDTSARAPRDRTHSPSFCVLSLSH